MVVKLPLKEFKKLWSPFDSKSIPWSLSSAISIKDVEKSVQEGKLVGIDRGQHFKYFKDSLRLLHIRRIAWFVVNGIKNPITIHINPELQIHPKPNRWVVSDGNHRLAAAIVREDKYINVNIRGDLEHAEKLLGLE